MIAGRYLGFVLHGQMTGAYVARCLSMDVIGREEVVYRRVFRRVSNRSYIIYRDRCALNCVYNSTESVCIESFP